MLPNVIDSHSTTAPCGDNLHMLANVAHQLQRPHLNPMIIDYANTCAMHSIDYDSDYFYDSNTPPMSPLKDVVDSDTPQMSPLRDVVDSQNDRRAEELKKKESQPRL